MTKIECSLCGIKFEKSDELLEERKQRHNLFHSKARIQKRNTTQGQPNWLECED